MKQEWRKDLCIQCRNTKDRNGIVQCKWEILKLQRIRRGREKGRSPQYIEKENELKV